MDEKIKINDFAPPSKICLRRCVIIYDVCLYTKYKGALP